MAIGIRNPGQFKLPKRLSKVSQPTASKPKTPKRQQTPKRAQTATQRSVTEPEQPVAKQQPTEDHLPTDDTRVTVKLCMSFCNSPEQVAQIMRLPIGTLLKHYAKEIEVGKLECSTNVRANLYHLATRRDPRAVRAIFVWMTLVEGLTPPTTTPAPRAGNYVSKKAKLIEEAAEPPPDDSPWSKLLN